MHLEVQEPSEEVETGLFLPRTTVVDCFIHELLSLKNLIELDLLIDIIATKRISVRPDNRDDLQAVRIFVGGVFLPRFREELTRHEVILVIHPQNALAQPLIVDGRCINFAILVHFPYIILSNLVLLYRNIPIGSEEQNLMN